MISYSKYPFLMITLVRLLAGGFIFYLILCVFMFLYQDQMMFIRQDLPGHRLQRLGQKDVQVEEMMIPASDGVTLHGWWVNRERAALRNQEGGGDVPVVFFFGGNAEEVSHMVEMGEAYPEWSFVLMNYRGYGLSEGTPGEEALLEDALLIYDHVSHREPLDPKRRVAMGRSLGTGMAVYVAAHRDISAALLISPYDSMVKVAGDAYPFLPVNRLMRNRFEMLPHARQVTIPVYALIALQDEVVAVKRSRALLEAWGGNTLVTEVPRAGHNTLVFTPEYHRFLEESLGEIYSSAR